MVNGWYKSERWLTAPRHVVSAAATVLNDDGRLLMVKSPSRGWEIPGGQVELGEPLTDAVAREVLEESGIEIRITGFCGIYQTVTRSICNLLFAGEPIGGQLQTSPESVEVCWYPVPEALARITYGNFRERVERSLDPGTWPFLVEYHE